MSLVMFNPFKRSETWNIVGKIRFEAGVIVIINSGGQRDLYKFKSFIDKFRFDIIKSTVVENLEEALEKLGKHSGSFIMPLKENSSGLINLDFYKLSIGISDYSKSFSYRYLTYIYINHEKKEFHVVANDETPYFMTSPTSRINQLLKNLVKNEDPKTLHMETEELLEEIT